MVNFGTCYLQKSQSTATVINVELAYVCQFTHLCSYVKMRPRQNAGGVTLWYCTLSFIASEPKAV